MANDAKIPASEMVGRFSRGWVGPQKCDLIYSTESVENGVAELTRSDLLEVLAERQHWINVAAAMGNQEARALATEGWGKD